MTPELKLMVEAVKSYALANYSRDGWDVVVEAYTDGEILEQIAHCPNEASAVSVMRKIAKAHKEQGEDVCSESF